MAANTITSNLTGRIFGVVNQVLPLAASTFASVTKNFSGGAMSVGETVDVQMPNPVGTTTVTPSNVVPDSAGENIASRRLTVDQFIGSEMVGISASETSSYVLGGWVEAQVAEGIKAVAKAYSSLLHDELLGVPSAVGVLGTGLFAAGKIDPIANIRTQLNVQEVPDDGRREVHLSTIDDGVMTVTEDIKRALNLGSDQVIRTGQTGTLYNMGMYRDNTAKSYTSGAGVTTGLIIKTATAHALGATSLTCTTAASTGACAFKKGQLIDIGIYTYSVAADVAEASAATDVVVTIYHGLKVALTGGEAVTDSAAMGAGSKTGMVGVAGDMLGLAAVMRQPNAFLAGETGLQAEGEHLNFVDPQTGMPITISFYRKYGKILLQCSNIGGVGLVDERILTRTFSSATGL